MDIFILVLLPVVCVTIIGITYRKRMGNGNRASLAQVMPSQSKTTASTSEFMEAWSVGVSAHVLWGNDHAHEDLAMSRSAAVVLNKICDADLAGKFDQETDHNLRERLSVEEAERLYRERELRRFVLSYDRPGMPHAMAQQRKPCSRAVYLGKRFVPRHRCGRGKSKE